MEFLKEAGVELTPRTSWEIVAFDRKSWEARDAFIAKFGFAILDDRTVQKISQFGPLVLEVGAGSGYWAHELSLAGIDVIAVDPATGKYRHNYTDELSRGWDKPWHPIERIEGAEAVKKYPDRTLLMVWPDLCNHGEPDWPLTTVAAYRGEMLLYVGEGDRGCTGTDGFHEHIEKHFESVEDFAIPQFWGIHDWLQIYKRKPNRAISLE